MSELTPRRPSGLSRRQRERRAYALTLATGGFAVAAIVGIVLAAVGVIGFGLVLLLILLAGGSGFLLRRTLQT